MPSPNKIDMSFCNGCELRGQLIGEGATARVCARTAIDNMLGVAGSFLGFSAGPRDIGDIAVDHTAAQAPYVVDCIESVSAGGPPILPPSTTA